MQGVSVARRFRGTAVWSALVHSVEYGNDSSRSWSQRICDANSDAGNSLLVFFSRRGRPAARTAARSGTAHSLLDIPTLVSLLAVGLIGVQPLQHLSVGGSWWPSC